jgi:anti-anti-sigma factor
MAQSPDNTPVDDAVRLVIDYPMTIYNVGQLKEQLINTLASAPLTELDLSQVNEMDTAGFQLLALAKKESLAGDRELRIVGHSPAVQDVLEFFNMVAFFGDPLVIPASANN